MAVETKVQSSTSDSVEFRGMLPIALGTLVPAESLDFDLFVRSDAEKAVLFRGRDYPLEASDIRRLCDSKVATLYIRVGDHEQYCEYLREVVLNNADLPAERRVQVLMAVNRSVFESAFSSPNVNRYVEFAENFGSDLTDAICGNQVAMNDLMRLMSHDYYTFTHVANVTTYCTTLAARLGNGDREFVHQIAVGALLHDYGKRFIPASTLNCTGRLSEEQWRAIQQHPLDGFREFCERQDVSWGQLMMIYQHHERPDGKGYPVGVGASEIHEWARICKVADVFDALTSDRPYRKADRPAKVLEFMAGKLGTEFDKEMFECFQATINCNE